VNESQWEKYAALGGVWFVVLAVVSSFIAGAPPDVDDSAQKISDYFNDHAGAIQASQLIGGLSALGLAWWFGSLYRTMTRAEDGRARLSIVALFGLLFAGAMVSVAGAISSAVAMRIDDVGDASPFFYLLTMVLVATAGFGIVIFLGAVCALAYRTKLWPQWINILGWVAALAFLVGTIGTATDTQAFYLFGLIGFLLWSIWILVISVRMWQRPAVAVVS
jgi:hypothetical protein